MKLITPEVSWHETLPIYSCDIQPFPNQDAPDWTRLATAGGDKTIRLWKLGVLGELNSEQHFSQSEFLSSLQRHEKNVNIVRWSPSGELLASGSDDSLIILWRKNEIQNMPPADKNIFAEEEEGNQEIWNAYKTLRRHLEDVYDLCWSSDGLHLVSGSVDQCVIQWRLSSGQALILKDHRQYVQGVTWDPLDQYVISLGSDRSCRVYRVGSRNCTLNVVKVDKMKLFQDDSWKSFFRRLQFSPDGHLLICPAGAIEASNVRATDVKHSEEKEMGIDLQVVHAAHIFHRSNLGKPVISLTTNNRPVIAVRFCPLKFELKKSSKSEAVFALPYRWVYVLVLEDGLLFHDTQHKYPFLQISSIHYQALNDASWSQNGRVLVITSTDGYCSIIRFDENELGIPHTASMTPYVPKHNKKTTNQQREKSANKKVSQLNEMPIHQSDSQTARKHQDKSPPSNRKQHPDSGVDICANQCDKMSADNTVVLPITPPKSDDCKPVKRRVPLITLDPDTPISSPLRDSESPFREKTQNTITATQNKSGKADSPVVKEIKTGKRRLPSSQLKTIIEFDVDDDDSNPQFKDNTTHQEENNDLNEMQSSAKKRRVSFTTLSPEVRLYCPSETLDDVSSPNPKSS